MVIDSVEVGYNGVLRRTGRYGGFREVHEVCLRRTCWWGRIWAVGSLGLARDGGDWVVGAVRWGRGGALMAYGL